MDVTGGRASGGSETTTYVALLRGVNVGGHRLIKMPELKRLFETMGFGQVRTYIQSGNVIFTSADEPLELLRQRIEREIAARFGFPVTVVPRTAAELERVIADCPFAADALAEGESLYVALLADAPLPDGVERLRACDCGSDEARIAGRRSISCTAGACGTPRSRTLSSNARSALRRPHATGGRCKHLSVWRARRRREQDQAPYQHAWRKWALLGGANDNGNPLVMGARWRLIALGQRFGMHVADGSHAGNDGIPDGIPIPPLVCYGRLGFQFMRIDEAHTLTVAETGQIRR